MLEQLEQLKEIAKRHELNDISGKIEKLEKLCPLSVVFLGEFSSGKTSIINKLLGKDILPVGDNPTTKIITEIIAEDRENIEATIVFKDGEPKQVKLTELGSYLKEEREKKERKESEKLEKLILKIPTDDFFEKGIKFVDTPGINSIEKMHTDITFGYLPFMDFSILVIDINKGGFTESLLNFIKKYTEELSGIIGPENFIIVLNRIDTKSQQEVKEVLREVRDSLSQFSEEIEVIPVSIKNNEGIEDLKKKFKDTIKKNKENLIANRIKKETIRICEEITAKLKTKEMMSQDEEKKKEIKEIIYNLDNPRARDDIKYMIEKRKENAKKEIEKKLEMYMPLLKKEDKRMEIIEAIKGEIETRIQYDLGEIKEKIKEEYRIKVEPEIERDKIYFLLLSSFEKEGEKKKFYEKIVRTILRGVSVGWSVVKEIKSDHKKESNQQKEQQQKDIHKEQKEVQKSKEEKKDYLVHIIDIAEKILIATNPVARIANIVELISKSIIDEDFMTGIKENIISMIDLIYEDFKKELILKIEQEIENYKLTIEKIDKEREEMIIQIEEDLKSLEEICH